MDNSEAGYQIPLVGTSFRRDTSKIIPEATLHLVAPPSSYEDADSQKLKSPNTDLSGVECRRDAEGREEV